MNEQPFVSVIIVNYNGAHFLPACLDALQAQTYPPDRFEVIVSDNGSTDHSIDLLQNQYAWVRILKNNQNLGFTTGNNVAIQAARGEYLVLLNNDTAPHPDWLENLVNIASDHPQAGIITGHLHLFYDYITVTLKADTYNPPQDPRELGVQIFDVTSGVTKGIVQFLDGVYGWERDATGRKFRWTGNEAVIAIPTPLTIGNFTLKFTLAAPRPNQESVQCRILINNLLLADWTLSWEAPGEYKLDIPEEIRLRAIPYEQNTGAIIFRNGTGRDRGVYVKDNEALFEPDTGKYAHVEEVFAGCGASLLLKRELLAETGGFDDAFFMYYEDVDLCWRARLLGWKVLYAPDAIARHIHCGTTQEWSPFFIYLTERNRLAMILKNGSPWQVLRVWGSFLFRLFELGAKFVVTFLLARPEWRSLAGQVRIRMRVLITLLMWQPRLWQKRMQIQKKRRVSYQEIEAWLEQ